MDIVERLRKQTATWNIFGDAANEIERLQTQAHYHYENGLKKDVDIESLRDALRWAAPYTKDDPRVSAIIKAALKEGE